MTNSQNFEKVYTDFKQVRSNERDKVISMMKKIQNWKVFDKKIVAEVLKNMGIKDKLPQYLATILVTGCI